MAQIRATFARNGMRSGVARPSQERIARQLPAVPVALRPAAALAYRTMFSVCLETVRR